jgi:segregation and condensation protein B
MSQTPAQSPEGEPVPVPAEPARPGAPTDEQLKAQLETLLFITDHPLSLEELRKLTRVKDLPRLRALVGELKQKLEEQACAVQILEIAGGFQMATRPAHADLVRKLFAERMTMRLSTAAHETLAIVAYKQPLTRAEIEDIRGVEVIAALETLLEKRLIKVVGRKESVGRPLLYGTTADFMRHFGLGSLEDLPPIDEFQPAEPMTANTLPEGGQGDVASAPSETVVSEPAAPMAAEASAEVAQDEGASAPSDPAAPIWPSDGSEPEPPAEDQAGA